MCSAAENTGRAVRIVGARRLKKKALVLDHSGTVQRLGFPTDDLPLELDDGRPKESKQTKPKEQLPQVCPKCHAVKQPKMRLCPQCGHINQKQNTTEPVEGELTLVAKPSKKAKKEDKQQVYSELLSVQHDKGYSDGWTAHKFRAYFGVWPRGMVDIPAAPSTEMRNWLTSQNIRFSKSQEMRHAA